MQYDPKIIDDYIKSIDYYYFQDFCDRLLSTIYPIEYVPVRAGGRNGDMKNDGYCYASRIFFQAHATRGESAKQTKSKIEADLKGCLDKWKDVAKFVYITNDTLIGEVENYVDGLRSKFPNVIIETWGYKRLTSEIKKLKLKDIEFVIDRKIISEASFSESDALSTKFMITSEFGFIKEISENDLSNFPFENPILLENSVLKFLREITKGQNYRHTEIDKFISLDKDNYKAHYPDSLVLPNKENEYQFFFHKRIPKNQELKSITKDDNVSQFLLNNGISVKKVGEIMTCYESECGEGRFQELYQLRPFYAQFLIIKNISSFPIKLKSIESMFHDGVLYESSIVNDRNITELPGFIIEPAQNVIIPIGLFLSDFQDLSMLNQSIVTSTYVPEQVQQLKLGSIHQNQKIEFIGPRLVPKKVRLVIKEQDLNFDIHDFSFEKVYWVDRHWQCGSCPHLFFVQNKELKYQGEILSVAPNQVHTERFVIPEMITELIIAELEEEITHIDYLKINEIVFENQITLNEGETYSVFVSPNDLIEIKGRYEVNSFSNRTLSIREKHNLIKRFKNNYAYCNDKDLIE